MMKKLALIGLLLLVGCEQKPADQPWLGYAEGEEALIAAPQPGWLTAMTLTRGQAIKRGDTLFTLDAAREQAGRAQVLAQIAQARATLVQERANLELTRTTLARQDKLAQDGVGIPATRDQARAAYQQSLGRIAQMEGQIAQMQASQASSDYVLSQRTVVAQTQGAVQDIYFREGEYVPAGVPVVSVLPPGNIFVRFFVPQSQLPNVKMGQRVRITCDGCQPIDAAISFISAREEFTPPVIFSVGNREKLVFKLEARAQGGLKLNPGQPVEVRLP
jgi:HlyD family secretion protein